MTWVYQKIFASFALFGIFSVAGCQWGPVFGVIPREPYDIEVTGIEITQGIQNLDNDMPLIAGRNTIVRIYARETTGREVTGVTAMLFIQVVTATQGGIGGNTVSEPITVTPGGSDRLNPATSFNVPIDTSIQFPSNQATLHIRAIVNQNRLSEETNPNNNETDEFELQIFKSNPLRIHFVPVHLHTPAPNAMTEVDPSDPIFEHRFFDGNADFVIAVTPLRYHPIRLGPGGYTISWQAVPVFPQGHLQGTEWNLHRSADRTAVNAQLKTLKDLDYDPFKIYYGMVAPAAKAGDFAGWANKGVAWGVMASDPTKGGRTFAHEIGHRRGLAHMLCQGNESSGGGVDPNYPWPTNGLPCRLATVDPEGYFGFDVYSEVLHESAPIVISNDPNIAMPNRGFPLMGYKTPKWISPYEFCKLMPKYGVPCALTWPVQGVIGGVIGAMPGVHTVSPETVDLLQGATERLYLSGSIDVTTGRAHLNSFYRLDEPPPPLLSTTLQRRREEAAAGARSDWSVTLEDAAGRILYQHVIIDHGETIDGPDPATGEENEPSALLLNDLLPFPASTRVINIRHRNKVIATKRVSASRPQVVFREPTQRATLNPGFVIRWEAVDADGDPLRYALLYAADDGEMWTPIAIELDEPYFTVTEALLASLGAMDQVRFRVIASDGVNSASAISPASMRVENSPPLVTISALRADRAYISGQELTFIGNAVDREEGLIPGDRLVWRLNAKREIGRGARLTIPGLEVGAYTLTLEATDQDGLSARTSLSFEVRLR